MRVLIVGLGAIGRRHVANLAAIEPEATVTVWHQHSRRSDHPEASEYLEVFSLAEALVAQPQIALITSPASLHVGTALDLAKHGVHLLIEKPLSDRLEQVDLLIGSCRQRDVTLFVAYNFRFYEPLQVMRQAIIEKRIGKVLSVRAEVGQYLPDWRPGADYRGSGSAQRALGGGALLELSHEIDYVRWLVGEVVEVSAMVGRVSDLEVDVEDTAEIALRFATGAIGSIHLDMVQRTPARTCKVVGSDGTLSWDFYSHQVRWYSSASSVWTDLCPAAPRDRNEMYVAELRHFLDCVGGRSTPAVSGEDGRRVLEIALAARRSSDERRVVDL